MESLVLALMEFPHGGKSELGGFYPVLVLGLLRFLTLCPNSSLEFVGLLADEEIQIS